MIVGRLKGVAALLNENLKIVIFVECLFMASLECFFFKSISVVTDLICF